MADESIDRTIDKGFSGVDQMKLQTAEALEEAARKLRNVDMSVHSEDVKQILHDTEARIGRFKDEAGMKFHDMEADYHQKMEQVESIISDHPIPAVMVAAGLGLLIGMIICRSRD